MSELLHWLRSNRPPPNVRDELLVIVEAAIDVRAQNAGERDAEQSYRAGVRAGGWRQLLAWLNVLERQP